MSVLDVPPRRSTRRRARAPQGGPRIRDPLWHRRVFSSDPRDHEVMDEDWGVSPITKRTRARARPARLVGLGQPLRRVRAAHARRARPGAVAGTYLALLSHSGSRGPGAPGRQPLLQASRATSTPSCPTSYSTWPGSTRTRRAGQEYWAAMQLMGRYAAANHEVIHREICAPWAPRRSPTVENHHNFAGRRSTTARSSSSTARAPRPPARASWGSSPARWPRRPMWSAAAARRARCAAPRTGPGG